MTPLLLALLAAGSARAADSLAWPSNGYRLWSWTAVEGLPDDLARSQLRAQEQLAAELVPSRTINVYGVGAVGKSPAGDGPDTFELYRLHLVYRTPAALIEVGRLSRWDVRGRHHLDGIAAEVGSGALGLNAWGGQLWHPETWSYGSTLVAGAEGTWKPVAGVHTLAGAEVRHGEEETGVRLHSAASAWGARGQRVLALVEGQPEEGLRATVDGSAHVGQALEVELEGRWEGLEPATLPIALESPQAWLGGEGYAVGTAGARYRQGVAYVSARGGPAVHPGSAEELGGNARVEVGVRLSSGVEAGVAGVGAAIGEAWIAGGTLGGGWIRDELELRAEGGLFRYMPLAGGLAEVAEGRLRAELPLLDQGQLRTTRRLVLSGELAAGTDRILSSWLRGGLALHGTLAGPKQRWGDR